MLVKEVMSPHVEFVPAFTTLSSAAKKMRDMNTGFLPVSDAKSNKLLGVITDRDIVIRGVANNLDPEEATVDQLISSKVLYCFENDSIELAAKSMEQQHVYRLVVLDNEHDKRLSGILSLGDIMRKNQDALASRVAHTIVASAA